MLTKAQIKYIQSLGHKKFRDADQVFVAEGPKLINELLISGNAEPVGIYAIESFASRHQQNKAITLINEKELERISSLSAPNEVVGIFRKPIFTVPVFENSFSLMLDGIQDPGNLGTIIRCADWFGVQTIICSRETADSFNPKVVQATMGSLTRVQVIYVDLMEFINTSKLPPLYAATLNGENIFETRPVKKGVLIIGNEAGGIRNELMTRADHLITIPRKGKAESLNAAVAAGIIISHLFQS
ncbi:MAG TPA: RNA methyltransferase [Chitinophagaceae bacterium]